MPRKIVIGDIMFRCTFQNVMNCHQLGPDPSEAHIGPEVFLKTRVAMKFVDDDDDGV